MAMAYAERLSEAGLVEVAERGLGVRLWYGGPWTAARVVTAVRPAWRGALRTSARAP